MTIGKNILMSIWISKMKNNFKSYTMLGIAIILIAVGLCQKQNLMVLQKAIKICLECVGIG